MELHWIDLTIIAAYLLLNALIGVYVQKKATAERRRVLPRRPERPVVDARPLRLLQLHRHRRHDGARGRHVLPRPEEHLDDAHLLGLADHLLLHGVSGEVHPALRRA